MWYNQCVLIINKGDTIMKKKIFALLAIVVLTMGLMIGCGSSKSNDDELVVYFVPSRDPKEIQSATAPLADML